MRLDYWNVSRSILNINELSIESILSYNVAILKDILNAFKTGAQIDWRIFYHRITTDKHIIKEEKTQSIWVI